MFSQTTKTAANVTADLAKNDIQSTAEQMHSQAMKKADKAVNEMSDYANKAGSYVRDFVDDATGKIDRTNKMVSEEVRSNPLASIAIAAVIGYLFGAVGRSRR